MVRMSRSGYIGAATLIVALLIFATLAITSITKSTPTTSTTPVTTISGETSSLSPATSNTSSSIAFGTGPCGPKAQQIALNGTRFCADDVGNDTMIGDPGYSYFLNGSVTFMGVTFQTYCPSGYTGCPGAANGTATTVFLGIMRFTMTFPDGTNETVGAAIGDLTYINIFSSHSNPRAGMVISISEGAHVATAHVFLLVSEASPGTAQLSVTTVVAPAFNFATSGGGATFACSTVSGTGAWAAMTNTGTAGADIVGATIYWGGGNNVFTASGVCTVGPVGSSTSTIYLDFPNPALLTFAPVRGQTFMGYVTLSNGQEILFVGDFI